MPPRLAAPWPPPVGPFLRARFRISLRHDAHKNAGVDVSVNALVAHLPSHPCTCLERATRSEPLDAAQRQVKILDQGEKPKASRDGAGDGVIFVLINGV
jgi:hypothetical protein